jgi:hypothetical protein
VAPSDSATRAIGAISYAAWLINKGLRTYGKSNPGSRIGRVGNSLISDVVEVLAEGAMFAMGTFK